MIFILPWVKCNSSETLYLTFFSSQAYCVASICSIKSISNIELSLLYIYINPNLYTFPLLYCMIHCQSGISHEIQVPQILFLGVCTLVCGSLLEWENVVCSISSICKHVKYGWPVFQPVCLLLTANPWYLVLLSSPFYTVHLELMCHLPMSAYINFLFHVLFGTSLLCIDITLASIPNSSLLCCLFSILSVSTFLYHLYLCWAHLSMKQPYNSLLAVFCPHVSGIISSVMLAIFWEPG